MRATDVEPSRHRRGARGRQGVRPGAADRRAHRHRRLRRLGVGGRRSRRSERKELIEAIDRLQLQIAHGDRQRDHRVAGDAVSGRRGRARGGEHAAAGRRATARRSAPIDKPRPAEKKETKPVPPGSNRSAAIILLTDGRRTTGPDPLEAAKLAADRGRQGLHGRFRQRGGRHRERRRHVDLHALRRGNAEGRSRSSRRPSTSTPGAAPT